MSKTIPKISDKKLNELYERIRPVIRYAEVKYGGKTHYEKHSEGDLYYIKKVDPRGVAFTWSPEPDEKASGLVEMTDITTYHSYGYHGFFKPSVAEVLAQIPEKYLDDVVAFQTGGASIAGDYHSATTILYRKIRTDEISDRIKQLEQEKSELESMIVYTK